MSVGRQQIGVTNSSKNHNQKIVGKKRAEQERPEEKTPKKKIREGQLFAAAARPRITFDPFLTPTFSLSRTESNRLTGQH